MAKKKSNKSREGNGEEDDDDDDNNDNDDDGNEDDERNVEWVLRAEKTVNDRNGAEVEAAMVSGGKAVNDSTWIRRLGRNPNSPTPKLT